MGNSKGDRYERNLVKIFLYSDFGCLRLAASGGGTDDDLPDVFAGRSDGIDQPVVLVAMESKYRSNKEQTHYVDLEEGEQVIGFATSWGAKALWAARFKDDTTWYFLPVEEMKTTEKSLKWSYDECVEEWATMDDLGLVPYSDIPDEWFDSH